MQEYWELYMKNIEGYPASVLVNVGISLEIEELKETHPSVAFVKVKLEEPNEKGLLGRGEEAEILFLEDKLEVAMLKFRIGKYVGRVITNGSVTFIFYLQFTYNWQDFLDFALDEFGHYEITSGFQDDGEWNYYQKLLMPTAKEWQLIQNHKVCKSLHERGDDLQTKRAIEHRVYFQDISKKGALLEVLEKDGFKFMEDIRHEDGYEGVKFYRMDKPYYYDIDEITLEIIDLALEFDALYDGWETSLVKA